MNFRNPWIDPRIVQLGPADAKAYLIRHGWRSLGPASNPILEMLEGPGASEARRLSSYLSGLIKDRCFKGWSTWSASWRASRTAGRLMCLSTCCNHQRLRRSTAQPSNSLRGPLSRDRQAETVNELITEWRFCEQQ